MALRSWRDERTPWKPEEFKITSVKTIRLYGNANGPYEGLQILQVKQNDNGLLEIGIIRNRVKLYDDGRSARLQLESADGFIGGGAEELAFDGVPTIRPVICNSTGNGMASS